MTFCPYPDRHRRVAQRAGSVAGAVVAHRSLAGWVVLALATALAGCHGTPLGDVEPSASSTSSTSGTVQSPSTTSPTADGTTAGSSGDDEASDDVFPDPDPDPDAGPPSPLDCDLWQQDCPEGQKCVPFAFNGNSWDFTRCVPIAEEPGQPGDPCIMEDSAASGFDDCEAGSMCWDVDPETLEGTCVAMCTGSPEEPMCDPNQECVITNQELLILCLPSCDPLQQDCPEGEGCYHHDGAFFCAFEASDEDGAFGDECWYINDCDPGLLCVLAEAIPGCRGGMGPGGCCTMFCDVADPMGDAQCPDMPEGLQCLGFFEPEPAPPEHADLGACYVPPP